MNVPLIRVEDATFHAGDREILQHATWSLHPGQHTAVLGCNGSGKSTLLRIATGQLRVNRGGRVLWQGQERIDLREMRKSTGWVSNELATTIPRRETVLPLIVSGRHAQIGLRPPIRHVGTPADRDKAMGLLLEARCEGLAERRFCTLSQGEQQSVLLLRALMALPLLIVLDEPCSGLDPGARERFLAILANVLDSPSPPTLVMVTHHVEEILPGMERVLIMRDGKIEHQGATEQSMTTDVLGRIYGMDPREIVSVGGRFWPVW